MPAASLTSCAVISALVAAGPDGACAGVTQLLAARALDPAASGCAALLTRYVLALPDVATIERVLTSRQLSFTCLGASPDAAAPLDWDDLDDDSVLIDAQVRLLLLLHVLFGPLVGAAVRVDLRGLTARLLADFDRVMDAATADIGSQASSSLAEALVAAVPHAAHLLRAQQLCGQLQAPRCALTCAA